MKKLMVFAVALFLFGCASGDKLNIVSPSMSDEETKARAKAVLQEKKAAEKQPEPSQQPVSTNEDLKSESGDKGQLAQEALINLLIRKGVITQKELQEEIERARNGLRQ